MSFTTDLVNAIDLVVMVATASYCLWMRALHRVKDAAPEVDEVQLTVIDVRVLLKEK